MNPWLLDLAAARTIEFIGTNVNEGGSVAMIGMLKNNYILAPGVRPSEPEREFIGFAAGVQGKRYFQWSRKECGQPFGIFEDVVVQIARVGVKQADLLLCGGHEQCGRE